MSSFSRGSGNRRDGSWTPRPKNIQFHSGIIMDEDEYRIREECRKSLKIIKLADKPKTNG